MCWDELRLLAIGAGDGVRVLREALIFGNGHLVRLTERVFTGIKQRERKRFAPPWIRAAEIQI